MAKKVLILSGSPRRGGNSDLLCDSFMRGALEAGHTAEKIFISDMKINFCKACGVCYMNAKPCVYNDDMAEINEKMIAADVIVMATPVYFYAMSGQLKTLIDRTITRFTAMPDKDMYFIIAAHDTRPESAERVMEAFRGYMACLKGSTEKRVIFGGGVFNAGEIADKPVMQEAYDAGKAV